MKELHDALTWLGPVEWNDVPTDNLEQYASDCLAAGELIAASVPHNAEGTPFNASKPSHSEPNLAKSHKDIVASEARSSPPHEDHEKLLKSWGKPYKFKKEENPLGVSLYKLAGNDRHGAWFARRSIHEGIGFDKFKRAMMREFSHALTVQGEPGAGAVRGIAADRRLERIDISEKGKLEVYELSAAFPGPVTPRDFVTMIISSDKALSGKSAADVDGKKHLPRHFMVVSKPVVHPNAPQRSGLVRGQYESVELIREIPLSTAKSRSTTDLLKSKTNNSTTNGDHAVDSNASHEPELNPVEWIMISRSDPGGGIPRFLVERGTPSAMLQDQIKFFDWACALDDIPHPDDDLDEQKELSAQQAEKERGEGGGLAPFETNGAAETASEVFKPRDSPEPTSSSKSMAPTPETTQTGYFSGISNALEAGIEAYAPTSVSNAVLNRFQPQSDISDDSSDTSSVDSFMSAEDLKRVTTAPETPDPAHSNDNFSIMSGDASESTRSVKDMSHHEKEVHKLSQKREKLEQQLAKKRMAEEQKLREAQEKEQSESGKSKEKIERELKKIEEKHRKEIEKLEAKKAKEERKAEAKRKKKDEQNKISLVTRERDDFRGQVGLFRRENSLLREQVADLQSTNHVLAQRLAALGGPEALKGLDEVSGHKRSVSVKSTESLSKKAEAVTTP
ncbi:Putative START-like domain superfamily protein [Septoria linicola]|uniref:START-like domain superfamily protein n=1 Tax=Septoria linicola TaxID=215465 RepID=A0A9Q9AHS2_9PEZI|nr:putative START-like domain superfamily protein [Septoria linicola]USW47964.1 Putative START-like domain superfamily protein [Septoria linicola]